MRGAGLCFSAALLALLDLPATAAWAQGAPLDVTDATPRGVFVQVEDSSDLGVVGQSFGPAFPASYSVSGSTGTLTISAETHEQMRSGGALPPVSGSFTPIVIQIDLGSLAATSQVASGAFASGPVSASFTQQALGTATAGGFAGPSVPPLFCTSQAQIDQLCAFVPSFCGQTCTLVPGSAYDTATGRVNLIGRETEYGCDGSICFGPFDYFTQRGDLRLSEGAEIPALPGLAAGALALLLAACARRGARAA
jgi:hypothetical protein